MAKAKPKKGSVDELLEWPMEMKVVPIQELMILENNPNKGDLKRLKKLISKNGFLRAVTVQKSTMSVLAGNHSVIAAKELGYDKVPVSIFDLPDDVADRHILGDNKARDGAKYDEDILAERFKKMGVDAAALDGTGYSPREAEIIIERAAWQDDEDITIKGRGKQRDSQEVTNTWKGYQPKERNEILEDLARRSVILSIPVQKHKLFAEAMRKLREMMEVRTNEEAIVKLMQKNGYFKDDFVLFEKSKKGKKK